MGYLSIGSSQHRYNEISMSQTNCENYGAPHCRLKNKNKKIAKAFFTFFAPLRRIQNLLKHLNLVLPSQTLHRTPKRCSFHTISDKQNVFYRLSSNHLFHSFTLHMSLCLYILSTTQQKTFLVTTPKPKPKLHQIIPFHVVAGNG